MLLYQGVQSWMGLSLTPLGSGGLPPPPWNQFCGRAGGKGELWKLHLPWTPDPQNQRWRWHAGTGARHVACCFAPHFCATAPFSCTNPPFLLSLSPCFLKRWEGRPIFSDSQNRSLQSKLSVPPSPAQEQLAPRMGAWPLRPQERAP